MKKLIVAIGLIVFVLINTNLYAQTGVNTRTVESNTALHIDSKRNNNPAAPSTKLDDVVITESGYLGLAGTVNPKTRVDMRSASNGIIAIGTTDKNASDVGEGALRYNHTSKMLEYSDGERWIELPIKEPEKLIISAHGAYNTQTFGDNTTTKMNGWTTAQSISTDIFDGTTFKAPRAGYYLVSINIIFASGNVYDNSKLELQIVSSNNSANNLQSVKFIETYPGTRTNDGWLIPSWRYYTTAFASGSCYAIMNLRKGDTVFFQVINNLGASKSLYKGNGQSGEEFKFNHIAIYEL